MLEHMQSKGLSKRAACRWSGISHSVGSYELCRPAQDAECLEKMHKAALANPRYRLWAFVAVVEAIWLSNRGTTYPQTTQKGSIVHATPASRVSQPCLDIRYFA